MLVENKLKVLQDLINGSSQDELIWINGYLSGVISQKNPNPSITGIKSAISKITILYGTETGNAKKIATSLATRAKKTGINAKVVSMDQYRTGDLIKEEYLISIVSTHGEGEPPAAAKKFYDQIHLNGIELKKLKYSVLALGDTSYPLYCKTGEDVDAQFQKMGGSRLVPLQKCDVDFEAASNTWIDDVLQVLNNAGSTAAAVVQPTAKKTSGKKTYQSRVLANINLNDRGSNKETYHIELEAEDIQYQPGDSIGVIPENPVEVVNAILELVGIDDKRTTEYNNEQNLISNLLLKKLNIIYLPERVVNKYAEIVQQEISPSRKDLIDLLTMYPINNALQFHDVINILEPITPRLYSIASSPEGHSGEIHITVAKNNFNINNEIKYGLTSDFLAQLLPDTSLNFYIHPNSQFRLPEEDKDIIMIGPGTGIAPFRSFIAQRDATGASGRNWLFFGEQHFFTDFLYQTEIQNWLGTGVLTKVNVAFSRDQKEKVYVQHKMLTEGEEFFHWLDSGAFLYICGTKLPMSIDVENTLLKIIRKYGNRSQEEAIQYLDDMKEDGRYLKDVY
ncbi:MAG: flavodoxin domain-containing protein [Chitinophagaceae bacterium]